MFVLECQDDFLRITEDPYYILSCLEDLPVARYSDGRPLTSTRTYRDRKQKGIEVGFNNYKPPILGSKRAEQKVNNVELKQYATADEKMAKLAREHNNANILVLGSRLISESEAIKCLLMFFKTKYEGGRHQARLDKFNLVKYK